MIPRPSVGIGAPYVLYSDFNCPFCYAMHERLHARGVLDRVEWRGVQHAPHLSIPMGHWNGRMMEELRREVEMVGRLAPDLSISVPKGKPNTGPAIQLAAQVLARAPETGARLVRSLYHSFWRDGRDLSHSGVLGELLVMLGVDTHGLSGKYPVSLHLVEAWNEQWRQTGQSGVPRLVRSDGAILVGLAREVDFDRFLSSPEGPTC